MAQANPDNPAPIIATFMLMSVTPFVLSVERAVGEVYGDSGKAGEKTLHTRTGKPVLAAGVLLSWHMLGRV
jgi:hypothetical protein